MKCTNCGAFLPKADLYARSARCTYCGVENEIAAPPPQRPVASSPRRGASVNHEIIYEKKPYVEETPAPELTSKAPSFAVFFVVAVGILLFVLVFVVKGCSEGKSTSSSEDKTTSNVATPPRYPFSSLAAVDTDSDVDRSQAEVAKLFPGATRDIHIYVEYAIPVAHPWFKKARLGWENKAGGSLYEASLWAETDGASFGHQADVEACLGAAFGAPYREEMDHARGTYYTRFSVSVHAFVAVYDSFVDIHLGGQGEQHMPAATWKKLIATVAACATH